MPEDVDEFLEHFGVKGMHWGHHKVTEKNDTPNKLSKKKQLALAAGFAGAAVVASKGASFVAAHGPELVGTLRLAGIAAKNVTANSGSKFAGETLKEIGNLSVYALQKSTTGAWS